MATNLTVRFSTLTGQDQARTYSGDLGFTPSVGMYLDVGAPSRLIVRQVVGHLGGDVDAIVDCRIFEDTPTARLFANTLTAHLQSVGWTQTA